MALHTGISSNKTRLPSLISASVLVTGLLLMAFVSGAGDSTAAHSSAPVHAIP
ncbi:hypothetical protein U1701_07990 [Sphingomonas sp. PB2P19]|uniref:hypothetical protein n=1 Tax=Sphingomonas rhamnosi TaxID=3096156 RepID=UPI002FCC496F